MRDTKLPATSPKGKSPDKLCLSDCPTEVGKGRPHDVGPSTARGAKMGSGGCGSNALSVPRLQE
eukprot:3147794-Heterocapsa_arctica.AAC.1